MVEGTLTLFFHSAKDGRKIDIIAENPSASFTIFNEGELELSDIACRSGCYYSSVIGNGKIEFVEELTDKKHALSKMFIHQFDKEVEFDDNQANSVCVFKLVSNDFVGKQKSMAAKH